MQSEPKHYGIRVKVELVEHEGSVDGLAMTSRPLFSSSTLLMLDLRAEQNVDSIEQCVASAAARSARTVMSLSANE